jgi:hypothetical protein
VQYSIEESEGMLRVQISGRQTDTPPSEVCAAILRRSAQTGHEAILIELDQQVPLSPSSQYALVTRLPELGFTHRHRIAMVHRTPIAQQANQFVEVIAGNRGLMVRNFPEVADAKAWLRATAEA